MSGASSGQTTKLKQPILLRCLWGWVTSIQSGFDNVLCCQVEMPILDTNAGKQLSQAATDV